DTTQSHLYLLFPNAGRSDIRVAANERIELRPSLRTTGPPGVDRYVAMVSQEPRQFRAPEWRLADDFREFALGDAASAYGSPQWSSLSFGGTSACKVAAKNDCSDAFGAVEFTIDEVPAASSARK